MVGSGKRMHSNAGMLTLQWRPRFENKRSPHEKLRIFLFQVLARIDMTPSKRAESQPRGKLVEWPHAIVRPNQKAVRSSMGGGFIDHLKRAK